MSGGTPPTGPPTHRQREDHSTNNGLPPWLNVFVVLLLGGLFAFNIIRYGPDGLGTSYVIGGLLGAYSGVDQLVRRRRNGDGNGGHRDDGGEG